MSDVMRQTYKELSEVQKQQMAAIKSCGEEMLSIIAECGGSRELSLARTKAEEAVMWAVKHITA